jgi:hypothetical protein
MQTKRHGPDGVAQDLPFRKSGMGTLPYAEGPGSKYAPAQPDLRS